MPNTYFQFKQFTIHQDRCAMKVCTDACILGAWVANKNISAKKVLDIGSGTGLLMLMLAQKQDARFTGIEIDEDCFGQLVENVRSTKWKDRVELIKDDVRDFNSLERFEFIISNPPFYENSLSSPSANANLARHSSHLNLEELLSSIDRNLSASGSFAVLLPYHRSEEFEILSAQKNFKLIEKLLVKQSPRQDFFRSILYFSRQQTNTLSKKQLVIQKESGEYTEEFIELLKDYYLYLVPS